MNKYKFTLLFSLALTSLTFFNGQAMESQAISAQQNEAVSKSDTIAHIIEAMASYCKRIVDRFDDGELDESDINLFYETAKPQNSKEDDAKYDALIALFDSDFGQHVIDWLNAFKDVDGTEPNEKMQMQAILTLLRMIDLSIELDPHSPARKMLTALKEELPRMSSDADLAACDEDGNNELHRAVNKGSLKECENLLDRGVSAKSLNNNGQTPLHRAAYLHREDIMIAILKKDPLSVYVRGKHGLLYQLLLERPAPTKEIQADVHEKHEERLIHLFLLLINHGALLDTQNAKDRATALHGAARRGYIKLCKILLDHGAHRDIADEHDYTPLLTAATYEKEEACSLLIERGAKVKVKTNKGKTALLIAAGKGLTNICRQILAIDPTLLDVQDEDASTPLMAAADNSSPDAWKLLLMYGASLNITRPFQRTALTLAMEHGYINHLCSTFVLPEKAYGEDDCFKRIIAANLTLRKPQFRFSKDVRTLILKRVKSDSARNGLPDFVRAALHIIRKGFSAGKPVSIPQSFQSELIEAIFRATANTLSQLPDITQLKSLTAPYKAKKTLGEQFNSMTEEQKEKLLREIAQSLDLGQEFEAEIKETIKSLISA